MSENLWPQWFAVAEQPEVDSAIADLYARLDAAIAERGPTCWQSGKCCNFSAYGHRLYVTGLEIARFVRLSGKQPPQPTLAQAGTCPWQVEGKCSEHPVRPLGCRIFFCQQGTQDWQQDLYEQYLRELRALHDAHGIEYRYMEWLAGLTEAAAAVRTGGG